MMIDENEFFRDATLRLCGHLEFEDALLASVRVEPKKLLDTGYKFKFVNLSDALGHIL